MNIDSGGYSSQVLLNELVSSSRKIWYEYTVSDINDKTIGMVSIDSGSVSFDSRQEIMRTFSGNIKKSELLDINTLDERVMPWMCMELANKDTVKWPLGRFIINPSEKGMTAVSEVIITGYDMGKIAYDDKMERRFYVPAGTVYSSAVAQILGTLYNNLEIAASAKTKAANQEWGIGSRKLSVVNDLLKSINYNPLHFDEYGKGIVDEYVFPVNKPVDITYSTKNNSIILDGFTKESNKFDIANKYIRYTESVDAEYLISIYLNDDPLSPYSTVNRGRVIVDSESVNDIATQEDLDNYVKRVALSAMQGTETLNFETLNMPGHGYLNSLQVQCELYDVDAKYIEVGWEMNLSSGGKMKHICERILNI